MKVKIIKKLKVDVDFKNRDISTRRNGHAEMP